MLSHTKRQQDRRAVRRSAEELKKSEENHAEIGPPRKTCRLEQAPSRKPLKDILMQEFVESSGAENTKCSSTTLRMNSPLLDVKESLKLCNDDDAARIMQISYSVLLRRLDSTEVVPQLFSMETLDVFAKESIEAEHAMGRHKGTAALLEKITHRGKEGFITLYTALEGRKDLRKICDRHIMKVVCERMNSKRRELLDTRCGLGEGSKSIPRSNLPIQRDPNACSYELRCRQAAVAAVKNDKFDTRTIEKAVEGTSTPSRSPRCKRKELIKDLNAATRGGWYIRCLVSHMTSIGRFYKKGTCRRLFKVQVCDDSGSIWVLAWTQECDRFIKIFKFNTMYEISCAEIVGVNSNFNKTGYDFEIHLTAESGVRECNGPHDEVPIHFSKLSSLHSLSNEDTIDVIGIAQKITKITSQMLEVSLIDDTSHLVSLQLWQNEVRGLSEGDVLLIRDGRLSNWYSPRLSARFLSTVVVNPRIAECQRLHDWHQSLKAPMKVREFTQYGLASELSLVTLERVTEMCKSSTQNIIGILVKASIRILKEHTAYESCLASGCNRKVTPNGQQYQCTIRDHNFTEFRWRIRLKAHLVDGTVELPVTCFGEPAETIVCTDADSLRAAEEKNKLADSTYDAKQDEKTLGNVVKNAYNREFAFRIDAKWKFWDNKWSHTLYVNDVQPLHLSQYTSTLDSSKRHRDHCQTYP